MATTAGTLITNISIRVRDPNNTGTSRVIIRDLLSRCQQYANAALDSVLNTVSLATIADTAVYPFISIAPDIIRIKTVRDGTRDLSPIPFNRLKIITSAWYNTSGPRFETWSLFGRQTLILHPNRQVASSVNVVYTQQIAAITSDTTLMALQDDQLPLLERMVEAILLLKARDMEALKQLFDETQTNLIGERSLRPQDADVTRSTDGTRESA